MTILLQASIKDYILEQIVTLFGPISRIIELIWHSVTDSVKDLFENFLLTDNGFFANFNYIEEEIKPCGVYSIIFVLQGPLKGSQYFLQIFHRFLNEDKKTTNYYSLIKWYNYNCNSIYRWKFSLNGLVLNKGIKHHKFELYVVIVASSLQIFNQLL